MNAGSTPAWPGIEVDVAWAGASFSFYEALHRPLFALVPAERLDELPDGALGEPVVAAGFEASAHLMPRLVALHALDRSTKDSLLELTARQAEDGEQPAVAALVECAEECAGNVERLSRHIRRAQSCRCGVQTAWLRLHDPYVFVQLMRLIGEPSMPDLFGPVVRWHMYLGGRWCVARPPVAGPRARALERSVWHALQRIGVVNRALIGLRWRRLEDIFAHSAHFDMLAMRAADRHGLDRPADQSAFAMLGALLREDFDEHPALSSAIATHRADQTEVDRDAANRSSLIEVLQSLPDATWQQVREQYARTSHPRQS